AHHGFRMALQQLLGLEASFVAAPARTPTAVLVPWLEGTPPFHHREALPVSARRPVPFRTPRPPGPEGRTKSPGLRGIPFSLLVTLLGDLFEGPAIAVQMRLLTAQGLPPGHRHVDILRVQLDAATNPLGHLRRCQGGARSQERIINQFAAFSMVQD